MAHLSTIVDSYNKRETYSTIQKFVGQGMVRNRQRLEETSGSLLSGLVLCTHRASRDECGDVRDHGGPAKASSERTA